MHETVLRTDQSLSSPQLTERVLNTVWVWHEDHSQEVRIVDPCVERVVPRLEKVVVEEDEVFSERGVLGEHVVLDEHVHAVLRRPDTHSVQERLCEILRGFLIEVSPRRGSAFLKVGHEDLIRGVEGDGDGGAAHHYFAPIVYYETGATGNQQSINYWPASTSAAFNI